METRNSQSATRNSRLFGRFCTMETQEQENINPRLIRWEQKKRMWYNIYLFIGVGINFLLYFTKPYGFDPGKSIFWGSFFGLGIPLATIFVLSHLHQKVLNG